MVTERAPLETLDPRLKKILDWFTPEIVPGPEQTYIRHNLGHIYDILQGKRASGEEKDTLMKEAKERLEEVIDTSNSPAVGIPKLAAIYAVTGESRLADDVLEGVKGRFVKPSKALARLVHLSDNRERFDWDPREGYRMRSALIFLAREIAERRSSQATE